MPPSKAHGTCKRKASRPKAGALFCVACGEDEGRAGDVLCLAGGLREEDFLSGLLFGLLFGKLFWGKRGRAAVRAA